MNRFACGGFGILIIGAGRSTGAIGRTQSASSLRRRFSATCRVDRGNACAFPGDSICGAADRRSPMETAAAAASWGAGAADDGPASRAATQFWAPAFPPAARTA